MFLYGGGAKHPGSDWFDFFFLKAWTAGTLILVLGEREERSKEIWVPIAALLPNFIGGPVEI